MLIATVVVAMSVWIAETESVSAARQCIYGFWEFYRQYTRSAIHAASAAALTIFGLLVFIDPLFAAVAIAAYVSPPVVLYALGTDVSTMAGHPASTGGQIEDDADTDPEIGSAAEWECGNRDADSDTDIGDSDSDSDPNDGDTDSDSDTDHGDSDTDSDN